MLRNINSLSSPCHRQFIITLSSPVCHHPVVTRLFSAHKEWLVWSVESNSGQSGEWTQTVVSLASGQKERQQWWPTLESRTCFGNVQIHRNCPRSLTLLFSFTFPFSLTDHPSYGITRTNIGWQESSRERLWSKNTFCHNMSRVSYRASIMWPKYTRRGTFTGDAWDRLPLVVSDNALMYCMLCQF